MHRLVDKLVRQKKLLDEYGDLTGLLDSFHVVDGEEKLPAVSFLHREIELHKPEKNEQLQPSDLLAKGSRKHKPRTAPPLTPKQRRPREQMGLDSFIKTPEANSERIKINEQTISVVLNAADEEISALSSVDGEGHEILIDHREMNSTLPSYLASLGFKTRLTHLPHGDLRISERILIERKTARDLLASIKDGRLLSQCRSLRASASRPMLLIETGGDTGYALHPNAVLGALAHITLDMGIPVMMTKDAMETAHFVAIATQREQDLLEEFHKMANSEIQSGKELKSIMDEAAKEIDLLLSESKAPHPWLESAQQQLCRCYEHALSQMGDISPEVRETMNAFSPNIGALFTATEEVLIKQSGCTEEVAQRVLDLLKKGARIKSQ
jgi:ERCC4-type nuclease